MCRAPHALYEILRGELGLTPLRPVDAFLLGKRRIAEAFEN
jgi:hypothetical protein